MASETLIAEIRKISKACTSTPVEKLISNPDWKKLNFSEAKNDLNRVFNMFNGLLILPINFLQDQAIRSIIDSAKSLQRTIDSIKNFDITSGDDTLQKRDQIIIDIKNQVDHFYMETQKWISCLLYHEGNIQRNINELANAVTSANRMIASAKEEIQSKKNEIDDIVTAANEVSASLGVGQSTTDFSSEVSTLICSAKRWLGATVILGVLTLGVAFSFFFIVLDPEDGFAAIHLITTKLIILGVLFSAASWCGKIYKALMHQVTINKHRANAVKTFQAFTKAASDDVARDAVLEETTKSVFEQRPTGYLDKEVAKSQ